MLDFSFEINQDELDDPNNKGKIWLIPGYAASAGHINTLVEHLGRMAKPHPAFKQRRLTTRVIEDAELLANSIIQNGVPVNLAGHSRGGLVVLCALQILQDRHLSNLVNQSVLLSPTSNGVRREISALAKHLKIDAIGDLCPDSRATNFWQGLNTTNRKKIQVISQEGGDGFTSPEGSFVPGGTMFLTPHCGHQNAIRDPKTPYFQLTVDLVKHAVVFADQNPSKN